MPKYKRMGNFGRNESILAIRFYKMLIEKHYERNRNRNHAYPEIVESTASRNKVGGIILGCAELSFILTSKDIKILICRLLFK